MLPRLFRQTIAFPLCMCMILTLLHYTDMNAFRCVSSPKDSKLLKMRAMSWSFFPAFNRIPLQIKLNIFQMNF